MKLHFCLFFALFCQIYGQKSPVTAYTSRGPLVGYHLDLGNDTTKDWYGQADIFLGVPFATPPTGNLRYKVQIIFGGGGRGINPVTIYKNFFRYLALSRKKFDQKKNF